MKYLLNPKRKTENNDEVSVNYDEYELQILPPYGSIQPGFVLVCSKIIMIIDRGSWSENKYVFECTKRFLAAENAQLH